MQIKDNIYKIKNKRKLLDTYLNTNCILKRYND